MTYKIVLPDQKNIYEAKKNRLLASDKFKEIESMYNKLSNKSFFNKNYHKQYFDNIKNIKSNND